MASHNKGKNIRGLPSAAVHGLPDVITEVMIDVCDLFRLLIGQQVSGIGFRELIPETADKCMGPFFIFGKDQDLVLFKPEADILLAPGILLQMVNGIRDLIGRFRPGQDIFRTKRPVVSIMFQQGFILGIRFDGMIEAFRKDRIEKHVQDLIGVIRTA